MNKRIKVILKNLPASPGIYKMKDKDGNILYIGKSKNLKNRVRSYFNSSEKMPKIERMVSFVEDIEIVTLDTHLEARLLEVKEIKAHTPIYNAQFKRERGFSYIEPNSRRDALFEIKSYPTDRTIAITKKSKAINYAIENLRHIYPIVDGDFKYNIIPLRLTDLEKSDNINKMTEILLDRNLLEDFLSRIEAEMVKASLNTQYEIASSYKSIINGFRVFLRFRYDLDNFLNNQSVITNKTDYGEKTFIIENGIIKIIKDYGDKKESETLDYVLDLNSSNLDYIEIFYSEYLANENIGPFSSDARKK